ncbi:MAG: IS30 family transposase [Selenomonadaceae bacterium]|nr:IS30 family transposase [Selenomonadaceae bacterium]
MSRNYSTTITPSRERGQHLKFEDRVSIQIYRRLKYTLRATAEALGCSPSTIMYELRRGTGKRKGSRGRFPEYSAKRGQANYEMNRSLCHRKAKALNGNPFVDWVVGEVHHKKKSIDSCVGRAKLLNKYPNEYMVCTKTIYSAVWSGNIKLTPFNLPEALHRQNKKNRTRINKRIYGTSITERPEENSARIEEGHWEIDTVVGKRAGKESVILTRVEKKTDYYIAIKIPGKDADSVMAAMEVLREEYGDDFFSKVFKPITADNGTEFPRLSELEAYGVSFYFAHPYSSWERAQNERHNRIFRRYIPKGVSIDLYTAEQIMHFGDEINALPQKQLGYRTPEKLFEEFLDKVYSLKHIQIA